MGCLIFGVTIGAVAGLASVTFGYGPIGALVIYSVVGQIAMLAFGGVIVWRDRKSPTCPRATALSTENRAA